MLVPAAPMSRFSTLRQVTPQTLLPCGGKPEPSFCHRVRLFVHGRLCQQGRSLSTPLAAVAPSLAHASPRTNSANNPNGVGWSRDCVMGGGEDTEGSDNDRLAHIVGGAGSWEELHTAVMRHVRDPGALSLEEVGALVQQAMHIAAASGPQEPSVEVRLQCRAVVGVATLAGLVACAADEYDGPAALSPAQVADLLGGLGYLASRRLLERGPMLPREVGRLVELLVRRARKLSMAGELGPNQLAWVLRAAALLAPPGTVDTTWLREVEAQLLGAPPMITARHREALASRRSPAAPHLRPETLPSTAAFSTPTEHMSHMAHDGLAALMTAMAGARASKARRWRPSQAWLHAFVEQGCNSERIAELDGHELAAVVYGVVDLAWPTSSAPYVPSHAEMKMRALRGGADAMPENITKRLAAPLPTTMPRQWLQLVRAREAGLVKRTVDQLVSTTSGAAATQWRKQVATGPDTDITSTPATPSQHVNRNIGQPLTQTAPPTIETTSTRHSTGGSITSQSGSDSFSCHDDGACIQPSDLALLLVAYTRLGVEGFFPGRPPGLVPLPRESLMAQTAPVYIRAAAGGVQRTFDDWEEEEVSV